MTIALYDDLEEWDLDDPEPVALSRSGGVGDKLAKVSKSLARMGIIVRAEGRTVDQFLDHLITALQTHVAVEASAPRRDDDGEDAQVVALSQAATLPGGWTLLEGRPEEEIVGGMGDLRAGQIVAAQFGEVLDPATEAVLDAQHGTRSQQPESEFTHG